MTSSPRPTESLRRSVTRFRVQMFVFEKRSTARDVFTVAAKAKELCGPYHFVLYKSKCEFNIHNAILNHPINQTSSQPPSKEDSEIFSANFLQQPLLSCLFPISPLEELTRLKAAGNFVSIFRRNM